MYSNGIFRLLNINSHFPKAVNGSQTIGAFQKIMNLGYSLRNGAEHNTAVGDGFVTWNVHFPF